MDSWVLKDRETSTCPCERKKKEFKQLITFENALGKLSNYKNIAIYEQNLRRKYFLYIH